MNFDVPGLSWSNKRVIPEFQPIQHLEVYDLRGSTYDVQLATTICAGLINRPQPRVYLLFTYDDEYWLQKLVVGRGQGFAPTIQERERLVHMVSQEEGLAPALQEGECLASTISQEEHFALTVPQSTDLASVVPLTYVASRGNDALFALLDRYHGDIKGLIIYDPACIDSINVATTLAGLRSGIVVSPMLAQNLQERYQFPLIQDLRLFRWRNRVQAYLWAQRHLLPTCTSRLVAGMNPLIINGLRSFLVATRTFVYWLDSRRHFPDGRAGLLSERALMSRILRACAPHALHLGWVIDEFSGIALISRFAMATLPSDYFNNLEVWTAIKPSSAPRNIAAASPNAKNHVVVPSADPGGSLTPTDLTFHTEKGHVGVVPSADPDLVPSADPKHVYLSFTLSDGDNIQYCQHLLPQLWNSPVRGTIPLGWTLSPLLLQAAPAMAAFYRETATSHDELVAGPTGAGYMYPTHWPSAHLPKFLQQTGELMSNMGMTTLEVLDADRIFGSGWPLLPKVSLKGMTLQHLPLLQQFTRILAPYGMRGIVSGNGFLFRNGRWHHFEKIPVCHNLGLVGSVKTTLFFIKMATKVYQHRPLFLNVYVNAWFMGPAQIQQVMQELGDGYTFVLPRTLLAMLAGTAKLC